MRRRSSATLFGSLSVRFRHLYFHPRPLKIRDFERGKKGFFTYMGIETACRRNMAVVPDTLSRNVRSRRQRPRVAVAASRPVAIFVVFASSSSSSFLPFPFLPFPFLLFRYFVHSGIRSRFDKAAGTGKLMNMYVPRHAIEGVPYFYFFSREGGRRLVGRKKKRRCMYNT